MKTRICGGIAQPVTSRISAHTKVVTRASLPKVLYKITSEHTLAKLRLFVLWRAVERVST